MSHTMQAASRTLYIPLYGKAAVSRKGIILHDPKAEEIWAKEGFPLRGKSRSKWLAYSMSMRAAVYDAEARAYLAKHPDALVLHIGCGMDSRAERVSCAYGQWIDADLPPVIEERKRYYSETGRYSMLAADASQTDWIAALPQAGHALVIMEGLTMYLTHAQNAALLTALARRYPSLTVLADYYTAFGAKASAWKNPIRDVGAQAVSGIDNPSMLGVKALARIEELDMAPDSMIRQLPKGERMIFRALFAGRFAKSIYRMFRMESA
ncbi:MAG: class I SAM-dependent methyltransferase [Clostridia bacterium]|nr:class I SAM-dependent methyltransferase [Clostridia bacterium]